MAVAVSVPEEVPAGYKVVTTTEMLEMLERGESVSVPVPHMGRFPSDIRDLFVNGDDGLYDGRFSDEDLASADHTEVASVEYVGEMPVQCIMVDDFNHLYITDDFISTHQTNNIIFLKSTDDSLLETLEKIGGKTHQSFTDSKMVTHDVDKMLLQNEGKVSYTRSTVEVPVVSMNDMLFLPPRQSITFIASQPVVWNRNETILPMSWRLLGVGGIKQPGHEYSLQTIPTLSSAVDFDVRKNQPNFEKMLEQRKLEAKYAEQARDIYMKAYGYDEDAMARLDPDVSSDAIMRIVDGLIARERAESERDQASDDPNVAAAAAAAAKAPERVENTEVQGEVQRRMKAREDDDYLRYAHGNISRGQLVDANGVPNHSYDDVILAAWRSIGNAAMAHDPHFRARSDGGLSSSEGSMTAYIVPAVDPKEVEAARAAAKAAKDPNMRTYTEGHMSESEIYAQFGGDAYKVTDEFIKYLVSFPNEWPFCQGKFAQEVARAYLRMA